MKFIYKPLLQAIACTILIIAWAYCRDNKTIVKHITLNTVKHRYEVYENSTPLLLIHANSTGITRINKSATGKKFKLT